MVSGRTFGELSRPIQRIHPYNHLYKMGERTSTCEGVLFFNLKAVTKIFLWESKFSRIVNFIPIVTKDVLVCFTINSGTPLIGT